MCTKPETFGLIQFCMPITPQSSVLLFAVIATYSSDSCSSNERLGDKCQSPKSSECWTEQATKGPEAGCHTEVWLSGSILSWTARLQSESVRPSLHPPLHYTPPHLYNQACLKTCQRRGGREAKRTTARVKCASHLWVSWGKTTHFCKVKGEVFPHEVIIITKHVMAFCHLPPNMNNFLIVCCYSFSSNRALADAK